MEIRALELILQYGTAPALILLCVLMVLFRKDVTKRIDDLEVTIRDTREKISFVEQAYVKREDFYRDISGWRGDVKILSEKIDKLREEFFYLKGRYEELKEKRDAAA